MDSNSPANESRPPKPGSIPAEPPAFREESLQPVYLALDAAGVGTWEWNVDDNVIIWSRGVDEVFGLSPERTGRSWLQLWERILPDDIQKARTLLARLLSERTAGERFEFQFRIERRTGGIRWLEAVGSVVGKPGSFRLLGTLRDVTERYHVEDEAHFYRALLECENEASYDGILVVSSDRRILHYNRRFVEIWRVPGSVLASQNEQEVMDWLKQAVVESEPATVQTPPPAAKSGAPKHEELCLRDDRIIERHSAPIVSRDRQYLGRVWYYRDITERRKLEIRLAHSQRLESLNSFASGLAHDLNNILGPITAHAQRISDTLGSAHEAQNNLREIKKICEQARSLIQQIAVLSGHSESAGGERPAGPPGTIS
jgi:PAS domain S-box-containing protein